MNTFTAARMPDNIKKKAEQICLTNWTRWKEILFAIGWIRNGSSQDAFIKDVYLFEHTQSRSNGVDLTDRSRSDMSAKLNTANQEYLWQGHTHYEAHGHPDHLSGPDKRMIANSRREWKPYAYMLGCVTETGTVILKLFNDDAKEIPYVVTKEGASWPENMRNTEIYWPWAKNAA